MAGYLSTLGAIDVATAEVAADAGALGDVSSVIPLFAAPLFAYLALKQGEVTRLESRVVLGIAALASAAQAMAILRRWQA